MPNPEDRYRRWLDDEREAKRLDSRRREARRRCDAALTSYQAADRPDAVALARELDHLERVVELSLAFYLRHTANDREFLTTSFGARRARELAARLSQRKLSLLAELDRVRETRLQLAKKNPGRKGPGA